MQNNTHKNNKRAFTLIELIIIIAVLGVLVLLAAPKLLGYTEKAELTRIQHDTKVMENKMSEVLNQDNDYNAWDTNKKDLGMLILKNQLYEKEGMATRVDNSHLMKKSTVAKTGDSRSSDELGVGGDSIPMAADDTTIDTGYKIIPDKFKNRIGTKLDGTFYSNREGKVYYEPNKPLSIEKDVVLACVPAEDLDYEFSIINGKGTITRYNGTLTHLYIPSAFLVDGKCVPVKVIGKGAFKNSNNMPIESVVIPGTVTDIEEEAFEGNDLTKVEIPHSVENIGDNAFANNDLKDGAAVIKNNNPGSVTIGNGSFGENSGGLDNIVYSPVTDKDLGISFDKSTGTITGSTGFGGSVSGGSGSGSSGSGSNGSGSSTGPGNTIGQVVIIPPTVVVDGEEVPVKEIAKGAYQGQGIIYVEFPEGLEKIEDYAFAGNQLIGVDIPKSVGHVGNYAFAYNEVNKERTVGYVHINESDYVGDISKLGDIAPNGVKLPKVGQANLLEHIFITSSSDFEIPEDYNPGMPVPLKLSVNGGSYLNTKSTISFDYNYDGEVLNEEWSLNGEILSGKPQNKLPTGKYKVGVRIIAENGVQSRWTYTEFEVNEYNEFQMNKPGSAQLNDVGYSLGDNLLFNYTNSNNIDWIVPIDGMYKFEVVGAAGEDGETDKSKGGKGAKIEYELELTVGDIVNFKIHSKGNGGGGQHSSNSAGDGGGGTIVRINGVKNSAAGGGGGAGYGIGKYGLYDRYDGAGGNGGDGGLIGKPGATGENGTGNWGSGIKRAGSGGSSPSEGGEVGANTWSGIINYNGKNGGLHNGGGGGPKGQGGGGGGGAGGSSFIHDDLVNPVILDGQNSGNGKVILTLIKE